MARVLVDVSALSMDWFAGALDEMVKNKNVRFLFSDEKKFQGEVTRNNAFLQLFKIMAQRGRLDTADAHNCTTHRDFLERHVAWKANSCCDDSHLFAMIYEKPTKYVFTADARLAKCRGCLVKGVDKRYRQFTTVRTKKTYARVRHGVFGP